MTTPELAAVISRATIGGFRKRRAFRDIEYFCFLIGYPRSGSTLLGSLLNAHPEMVIAHEVDALRYVRPGLTRNQVFAMILDRDRQFAHIGRRWHGFDYALPGPDQDDFRRLRVIGDKHAGPAARRLHGDPRLLDRLRSVVGVPIRAIHLVRNPFDNIASMAQNHDISISAATGRYRQQGKAVDEVRSRLAGDELLDIRYETMAAQPDASVKDLCRFIGVEAPDEYVQACSALVDPGGRRSRDRIDWSTSQRSEIEDLIAGRNQLAGYTFDG
jgi:hypothetical protein